MAMLFRPWRMNLSEDCCLRMRCPEEGVLNVHLQVKRVNVVHQIIGTEFVGAEEFPLGTALHTNLSFPLSVASDQPPSYYFVGLVDALYTIQELDVCACLEIAELILSHVSGTDQLGQRLEVNVNAKIDILTHEEGQEQVPGLVAQMVDESLHGDGGRRAPKRSAHQLMKRLRSFKADDEAARDKNIMSLIGDQECSICFDDLILVLGGGGRDSRKMRLTEMPCSHIYHSSCLARWLKTSDSCPLCRFVITNS